MKTFKLKTVNKHGVLYVYVVEYTERALGLIKVKHPEGYILRDGTAKRLAIGQELLSQFPSLREKLEKMEAGKR